MNGVQSMDQYLRSELQSLQEQGIIHSYTPHHGTWRVQLTGGDISFLPQHPVDREFADLCIHRLKLKA